MQTAIFGPIGQFFRFYASSFRGIPSSIWWLSATQLVNRAGAMVIPFMTLYLTQKRQFSIADAGYVMMFFGVGSVVGSLLGGRLTDSWGYRKTMVASLGLTGLGFLVFGKIEGFWPISFAIFALSSISEAFRPAASVAITAFSTPAERTRSIALYRLAINLGWAVAAAGGGLLAKLDYYLLFVGDGLTCLAATAFLLWFFAKNKKDEAKKSVEKTAETIVEKNEKMPLRSPWADGPFLIFLALLFFDAAIFLQQVWTVPPFFKQEFGFDEWRIGWVMGLNGLIIVLTEVPLIFWIESKKRPFWLIRLGNGFYFASYLMFLLSLPPLGAAILASVFITFGETFVMPFQMTFATKRAAAGGQQGRYMALYSATWAAASVISPLVGTQIVHRIGWPTLWASLVAASAVCVAGFYFLEKSLPEDGLFVEKNETEKD